MKSKTFFFVTGLLCASAYFLGSPRPPRSEVRPVARHDQAILLKDAALEKTVRSALGTLPLQFVESAGQRNPQVKYVARGGGFMLALEPQQAAVLMHTHREHEKLPPQLREQSRGWSDSLSAASLVRVEFSGALPGARLTGLDPQSDKINSLKGNDPSRWRRDIPHFSRVRDEGIYPGIDAVFYGDRRQLEYDFVVAPGADPSAIHMRVEGAASVELTPEGGILARTPAGDLSLLPPHLYQQGQDQSRGPEVAGHYVWRGPGEIGFEIASYDRSQTLVIDPAVGVQGSVGAQRGSALQRGVGRGKRHPLSPPPDVPTPTGDSVALSTQLGGSYDDSIQAIAISATSGHVYVAGYTDSNDFPAVNFDDWQDFFAGSLFNTTCYIPQFPCGDAFVAEFDVSTINNPQLVNATYLGGSGDDVAWGLALGTNDTVYLAGETDSGDFPTESDINGYQPFPPPAACSTDGTVRPCHHVFFSVLDATLSDLRYSTYIAGTDDDEGYAVAVNAAGQAFLTGVAGANFPTVGCQGDCNAYQQTYGGNGDVFVAGIDPTVAGPNGLLFSTYVGGDGTDVGLTITTDFGNVIVFGGLTYSTISNNPFPSTDGAEQGGSIDGTDCGPGGVFTCGDGFVAAINAQGNDLFYSTYIGGGGTDQVNALVVDGFGDFYAVGQTNSFNLQQIGDCLEFCEEPPYQEILGGGYDAFVVGIAYNCDCEIGQESIFLATYLGGSNDDEAYGVAIDLNGDVYVSGATASGTVPYCDCNQFPTQLPLQAVGAAYADPGTSFVSVLDPFGANLIFSTFYGGTRDFYGNVPSDLGNALALDSSGRVYLAGRTTSYANATNTGGICLINQVPGALNDADYYNDNNGFLAIISPTNSAAACFSPALPQTINFGGFLKGTTSPPTSTNPPLIIYNQGSADLNTNVTFTGTNSGDFAVSNACGAVPPPPVTAFTTPAGGGACQLNLTFTPSTTTAESANLVLTNNSAGSPFTIPLTGTGLPPATATLLAGFPGATSPMAFGSQTLNTSVLLVASLTNTSTTSPIDITSASLVGVAGPPSPEYLINYDACSGNQVQAGGICTIGITFTPTAVGAAAATNLSVVNDGTVTPLTLGITGTGMLAPPSIMLPAIALTFAPQGQGTTSTAQGVTITNNAAAGSASLVVTQPLTFMGGNPGDFAATGCAAAVAPGSTCTIMVTFTPTATGARSSTLQIASNASNGTQTIGVSGTGLPLPMASPSPATLTFPGQALSTSSGPMNVTLTNSGGSNLTVSSLTFTGANPGDFAASGCTTAVAPNNSCNIVVTFDPQPPAAPAARSATLQIAGNASNGTQTVTVNGTALAPPTATPTPSPLTFATPQAVMTTSAPSFVTLSNTGGSTLVITSVTLTGGNAGDFTIVANGCGASLGAGGTCDVFLTFTPQAAGPRTTTLQFMDAVGTQNVIVNGTGVSAATATLAPAAGITFMNPQQIDTSSGSMPATLTNSGGAALSISGISTTGNFAAVSNNCGGSLAGNSACTINVVFTPAVSGTNNGSLMVTDAVGTQTITLTGTGFAAGGAQASLSAPLFFGPVIQGTTSGPQVVTVTNTGGAALTVSNAVATAQFGATNNCTMPLASGQNCMISVTFSPTATGTITGTLTITDNAGTGTQTVALSGLGATFSLAPPTGSPSSLTINPGDTANYTVGFASTPGLILPLMLSCASNAPYTICTVNPSSVTLGGPTPPTVTVTLQTNCVAQLVGPNRPGNAPTSGLPAPLGATWAAVLLLFALARRSRASGRWAGRLVPLCAALVMILLVVGFTACVSNNPPILPGSPTTPAGTFNVSVTATTMNGATNITKQLNLIIRVI